MGDNLENLFVAVKYWEDDASLELDWALSNFDKDKTKIILTRHDWSDESERAMFKNKAENLYLPKCAAKKFQAEIRSPEPRVCETMIEELIMEHDMEKLVTSTHHKSNIMTLISEKKDFPYCKIWFVNHGSGKLVSTGEFGLLGKDQNIMAEEKIRLMTEQAMTYEQTIDHLNKSLEKAQMIVEIYKNKAGDGIIQANDFEEQLVLMTSQRDKKKMVNIIEFSHPELKKATNDFDKSRKIGEGGFGCVYECILRCTKVAVKKLKSGSSQGEREFNQEVEILTKVRHPHLVSLIGICRDAQALIYEFMPNGSLDTFLYNVEGPLRKLSWQNRIRIATEICSALIFLHLVPPFGIAHGDLKPGNVLLDSNLVSKVTDFGISRELYELDDTLTPGARTENPKYTCGYVAPEFFFDGKLTPKSDVYSFGVMLLQFITGKVPKEVKEFVKDAMNARKFDILVDRSAGKWPIEEAKKLASLGLRCIEREGNRRPILATDVWPTLESMKRVADCH